MKKIIMFYNDKYVTTYHSMAMAAKSIGVTRQAIFNVLHFPNKYKTVKGYRFTYCKED